MWWKQRAKVKWLKEGDSNARFFHAYASGRRNMNFIHKIKEENGMIVDDQDQVEIILNNYFTNNFIKAYWPIIKSDVWKALDNFFTTGKMCEEWKKTIIVLIPKVRNPIYPSSFRPISLCTSIYKIAAKMILKRLLIVIHKLISVEQAAFLKDRSLSDNVLVAHEVFHKFRYSKFSKGLVTFKIDLEQAYDSMGWPTLCKALEYFGFPSGFSNLIMECVFNPYFSLSINGKLSNWIEAMSGFRQGCSLSPFLFILCVQLLSNALYQISHLLYANDILFFFVASMKMIKEVRNIINKFCRWTGQCMNKGKSGLLFGKSLKRRRRRKIVRAMDLKEIKEFSYLGIKMALRRLCKPDFQFLVDKFQSMLNIWGGKFISLAGRMTLVKTVLLSFPTFHSSLLLVPKSILYEIDKQCRDFIWSKSDGRRGIHYVNWENLCRPRSQGVRGVMTCAKKAGPLKAKLAWKYFQNKEALVHKLLVPKYGNIMTNSSANISRSVAWKLLKTGEKFLKPITRWRIVNGSSVNVIRDNWILNKSLDSWPTFVKSKNDVGFTVDNLITDGRWDIAKIEELCGPHLVNLIKGIQISNESGEDKLELIQFATGKIIIAMALENSKGIPDDPSIWKWLKGIKLSSKVENFWWRIIHNAIPTNNFLHSRRMLVDDKCPWGCVQVEDIYHIISKCGKLNEAIHILKKWGFDIPEFSSLENCFKWLHKKGSWMRSLYCNLVYQSWRAKNGLVHEGKRSSSWLIATDAVSYASLSRFMINSCLGIGDDNQPVRLFNVFWRPPPPNWIKVNVDASLFSSYKAGIGGVFRDHRGRFLMAFGKKLTHWDISYLELLSILSMKEVTRDWMYAYKGMIIEGDNQNVINFINSILKNGSNEVGDLSFFKDFNLVIFNYVGRNSNKLVDLCSNYAYFSSFIWEDLVANKVPYTFTKVMKEESVNIRL
ncbi:Putative ribonuclease H protein [Dendrobium catenatum]|uniref:Ribonuclease H protein n=1 Tax=Dendrobium catenatum TaxID=906689 RepID=A0A2I0WGV4_9ASPA|nr:Putative ribonuclease H protein [Dendrobium catenatum]